MQQNTPRFTTASTDRQTTTSVRYCDMPGCGEPYPCDHHDGEGAGA